MSVVFILLNVLAIILGYFALNYKLKRRRMEQLVANIPQHPSLPIIGHGHFFLKITSIQEMWSTVQYLIKGYDRIQKVWLGSKLLIVLSDPTYIEAVLSNPTANEKDMIYKVFHVMSSGIFSQRGKTWQSMRKPLNKLLHPRLIDGCQDIFCRHTETLLENLGSKVGKGVFDFYYVICYCTLDIICSTHGGVPDTEEQKGTKHDLPRTLAHVLEIAFQRVVKPQYYADFIFNLTKEGKINQRLKIEINKMAKDLVQKRLKMLQEKEDELKVDDRYDCYTDVIIDLGRERNFNVDQMSSWITDFLVAGFDTTAVAMSCAIVFLSMYPEYQEKVYEEQFSLFGNSMRPPDAQDLAAMTYLGQVFYETVRHCGIPAIIRSLSSDIKLDKYVLPKGSSAYLMFYQMHRDPRYWKHPDKFFPDHFLPEEVAARPKGAYLPFSSGPRGCPGKLYSITSVKTILSMIFRRFRFTTPLTPKTIKFKYSLMLEIAGGCQVEIFERK